MEENEPSEDIYDVPVSSRGRAFHYYGDYLRQLFVVGAVASVIALPFFPDLIPSFGPAMSIVIALTVVIFAGVTYPFGRWIIWGDLVISAFLFAILQYYAVSGYQDSDPLVLSAIREAIALIFLVSVYYSAKTVRGMAVRRDQK